MNKYALLGHPLTHSCSPIIHDELFKQNNINATYELLDILEDEIKVRLYYLEQNYQNNYSNSMEGKSR